MTVKEKYAQFLKELRNATGIGSFTADESGLVCVRVDDAYNLNLQLVEATGMILCFIEVAELPAEAPKSVYRDLLIGGLFGKDTAGGYFTLEPDTETVIYNYFANLETASGDIEDFIAMIEKMLQLCDIWAERINGNIVGNDGQSDNVGPQNPQDMFLRA